MRSEEDIKSFLEEFLTPVERIMLAKRVSIAVLLGKGHTYPVIAELLRVTPSTISSVSLSMKYKGSGYKKVVKKILKDERMDDFWEKIDEFLLSIPVTKGTDVVEQKKRYYVEKRKRTKPF